MPPPEQTGAEDAPYVALVRHDRMMGNRVGIDLVSVRRVREAISAHGERYLQRVYASSELSDCQGDANRLAGRFAVKEATVKVLRPGRDTPLPWTDMEVVRQEDGHVELILSGRAAASACQQGLFDFAISLSHEEGTACAVVVAQIRAEGVKDTCR